MDTAMLLRGILIGFSIAAPVGPIGVLCIRRTLAEGRLHGFVSGLGAATADAIYGGIAAFGLTMLSSLLIGYIFWLRLIGGCFLCYLGVKTFVAAPAARGAAARGTGALGAYGSTLLLTLTNPMTILSFAAIFAGVGAGVAGGAAAPANIVLGVFVGSALWWLLLSGGAGALRSRLHGDRLRYVNRASGGIILGFGLFTLYGIVFRA